MTNNPYEYFSDGGGNQKEYNAKRLEAYSPFIATMAAIVSWLSLFLYLGTIWFYMAEFQFMDIRPQNEMIVARYYLYAQNAIFGMGLISALAAAVCGSWRLRTIAVLPLAFFFIGAVEFACRFIRAAG
jgi:hypothetical protein